MLLLSDFIFVWFVNFSGATLPRKSIGSMYEDTAVMDLFISGAVFIWRLFKLKFAMTIFVVFKMNKFAARYYALLPC